MTIYVASSGRYYSDWEVGNRFEEGRWSACMWSDTEGWELVETEAGDLLYLEPVPRRHLPDGVRVTTNDSDFEVVEDTRETIEAPTFERHPALQREG
jgi:hypothetical protein